MDISELAEKTMADVSVKASGEDYEEDGYLYCGKCKEKKAQIKRNSYGEKLYLDYGFRCACERGKHSKAKDKEPQFDIEDWNRRQREAEERREREEREATEKRRDRAFSDIRLKKWTFDEDDNANEYITSVAKKYVEHFYTMKFRGKGLLFFGGVGTGKTFIAACIVNALVDKGISCKFTNFSRLANDILAQDFADKQRYIDSLNKYDLLVIDDFGSERSTEFMEEVVYSVVDARHKAGLPLIATTNLTGDNLKHPKDVHAERVYSRLFEMCIPVEVKGSDRRKLKLRDADKDLKELLGVTNGKD